MKRFADTHVHIEESNYENTMSMFEQIAACGVTDATLLAVCPLSGYGITQNLRALHWKLHCPNLNLRVFGSLHENDAYASVPYTEQVEKLLDLGCDGIKFIQAKPNVRKMLGKGLNHPDYDEVLTLLEDRQIPILIHSGDPETFWDAEKVSPGAIANGWFYGDGTFLSCQAHYDEIFQMLDKHPRLRVVLAHFFFLSNFRDEAERVLEKYPNVSFDLTPGWEMYLGFSKDIDAWQAFFEKYNDRILFGTDSSNIKNFNEKIHELVYNAITHDKTEFKMPCYGGHIMKGLSLSPETVEKICISNYLKYVGDQPKTVNMPLLKAETEKMINLLKDVPSEQDNVKELIRFLG